jgi:hypothetical protein
MTDMPTLDMTGWSIIDYELALDGLRQVSAASTWLQNQPRASRGGDYHPGADFIVRIGEDWCTNRIDEVVTRLRTIRFPSPRDDDRRVLLLLSYEASFGSAGDGLARVIQMALDQSARPA